MDLWTLGFILFDVALIAAFLKLRRHNALALPEPEPQQQIERLQPARQHLIEAADRLGLTVDQRGIVVALVGEIEGREARVEPMGVLFDTDDGGVDLKVILHDRSGLGTHFALMTTALQRPGDRTEIRRPVQVGDSVFQQRFEVFGPQSEVRARLTHLNRASLLDLPGHLSVWGGRLTYTARGLFEGTQGVLRAVQQARAALDMLVLPEDVPQRLEEVGRWDPEPAARAGAVAALITRYPEAERTLAACRRALDDPDPHTRLIAAVPLGRQAADVVEGLMQDPNVAASIRLRAIRLAGTHLPPEIAQARLRQILFESLPEEAEEAASALAQYAFEGAVSSLVLRLHNAVGPLAVAVVRALGTLADPTAEPALLDLLTHHHAPLREATAGALGALGTPAALPRLRERVAHERRVDVKGRLTWAIRQIQVRHTAEGGRLSLSEGATGGLAIAPGATGGLAITHEPNEGPDSN